MFTVFLLDESDFQKTFILSLRQQLTNAEVGNKVLGPPQNNMRSCHQRLSLAKVRCTNSIKYTRN